MARDSSGIVSAEDLGAAPPHFLKRGWGRAALAVGILAVVGSVVLWLPSAESSPDIANEPTVSVTRGDLTVTITEQGTLESADNTEIKCRVRGESTVIWVIESGSIVNAGDELVRLDTLAIEDAIAERTKYAHLTRSGAERAKADVARAELAIPEYLEGRYKTQLRGLEKDLAIILSNERTAQNMLAHAEVMSERGYISALELRDKRFAVTQAQMNVKVIEKRIEVLQEYTKAMELETLQGNLNAARARYAAEAERAQMDADRRDLALQELDNCVVRAERDGLVIYSKSEEWRRTPKIEEGAVVHQDQTLLLMPNLSQMQVKVGIHESVVDRIKPGMTARITLPERTLDGEVVSVAPVTRPAIWWNGNVVKYDSLIRLPSVEGLKPGMSAEVEILVERYEKVLTIPVTASVESPSAAYCWVKTAEGLSRRRLELGDTSEHHVIVKTGLREGEKIVLDPLASIAEAQNLALETLERATPRERVRSEVDHAD